MLRSLVRSRLMRLFLLIGIALGVLGIVADDASAATRTPCGSSLTWSVRPSLVAPDDAESAIRAAYEAVAGPARLDVIAGDAGDVRFLWVDRGTGDTTTPGTAQGTSLIGGVEFVQHAYAPGVEGDALRTQVLRDVLRDLGVLAPTSGPTLSPEDAAALTAVCAAAPPAPAPSVAPEDAPADSPPAADDAVPAPADDAPDEDAPADGDDAATPALSKTIGLALVAVALGGVGVYAGAPAVLGRLRRRRTSPDAPASTS